MPTYLPRNPYYKNSSFLTYWYDNAGSADNLNLFLSKSAADIIGPQFTAYQKDKQNLKYKMASIAYSGAGSQEKGRQAVESVFQLFEVMQNDKDQLRAIMEPDVDISSAEGDTILKLSSIQDGIQTLNEVKAKCKTFDEKKQKLQQGLKELIEGISPNGKYQEAINGAIKALWGSMCDLAQAGANIDLQKAEAMQSTEMAKRVFRMVLQKTDRGVLKHVANETTIGVMQADRGLIQILAIADRLPDFEESTKLAQGKRKTIDYKSSSGGEKRIKDDASIILDKIASKLHGCAINMVGLAGELAAVYGFLKAHTVGDKFDEFKGIEVSVELMGGKTFNVQKKVTPIKPTLPEDVEKAKQAIEQLEREVSKADAGITVSNGRVSATLGFSVKVGRANKLNDPSATGVTNITLQSGTSLGTLIENIELTNLEQHAVIELLATHGKEYATGKEKPPTSETTLNNKWANEVKPRLAQAAFVDMLTGTSIEGRAYLMIAGTTLVSMDTIIQQVIDQTGLLTPFLQKQSNSLYKLERSSFLALNEWLEKDGDKNRPDKDRGLERGSNAYSAVKERLYSTIIEMKMRINDLADFRAL